jgi:hypothetical protein
MNLVGKKAGTGVLLRALLQYARTAFISHQISVMVELFYFSGRRGDNYAINHLITINRCELFV